jgi:hypothetical protein
VKKGLARAAQLLAVFGLGLWLGGRWCAGELDGVPQPTEFVEKRSIPLAKNQGAESGRRLENADVAPAAPSAAPVGPGTLAGAGAAPDPQRADRVPSCHPRASEQPPSAVKSGRSIARVQLELINDCDDAVTVSWIDFEGKEQSPSTQLPGSRSTTSTYETHVFRLRLGDRQRTFLRDVVAPGAARARVAFCGCGSEPGLTSAAVEALDAGSERRAEPPVPQCTVPFEAEPPATTPSVTLGPRFAMVFRNSCTATRVKVDWVQFDGGLRPTAEVEPGQQFDQTTFPGHQWRVRDAMTGRWIRDFGLDGGAVVDLCRCD